MPIVPAGTINTTALIVPDLYVQIVPPQNLVLNGVPTNVIGMVGSAPWGPVNAPVIVGDMAEYSSNFGTIAARKYDMGTHVATAVQQGAQDFRCVRVTDGTDAAAAIAVTGVATLGAKTETFAGTFASSDVATVTITVAPTAVPLTMVFTGTITVGALASQLVALILNNTTLAALGVFASHSSGVVTVYAPASGGALSIGHSLTSTSGTMTEGTASASTAAATLNSLFTGSGGNGSAVIITGGGKSTTLNATVTRAGSSPELYAGLPNTWQFWGALDGALRTGWSVSGSLLRGPSRILGGLTAGYNFAVGAPTAGTTFTLTGGTDGASGVTAATLVGTDGIGGARVGMYTLRSAGCSIGMLADVDDSTQWTTIDAFGLSEGLYMIQCGPQGDTITGAITAKQSAGLDSYASKLMFGDWIYWNDPVLGSIRLVSPQGFVAGRLGNLSPEQSSLNKRLYSVVGSQKSGNPPGSNLNNVYSYADLQAMFAVGIDVIANPQPGGHYWGVRCGHNSATNPAVDGDNYTRLTNYIAATLDAGMGVYVGKLINSSLLTAIRATLLSFLQNLLQQGILGSLDGSLPFSVICDLSNNTPQRTELGYVQADVQVRYQAINEKFIINLEGGQTVQVQRQTTPAGQVGA